LLASFYIIHIVDLCADIAQSRSAHIGTIYVQLLQRPADGKDMLNRLPKEPGPWRELLRQIGNPDAAKIARALGVSTRTVQRWNRGEAPRAARLSLWWLSHEGHSVWDCEMHERTRLATSLNAAMWRELGTLRKELANSVRPISFRTEAQARNDPGIEDASPFGQRQRLGARFTGSSPQRLWQRPAGPHWG